MGTLGWVTGDGILTKPAPLAGAARQRLQHFSLPTIPRKGPGAKYPDASGGVIPAGVRPCLNASSGSAAAFEIRQPRASDAASTISTAANWNPERGVPFVGWHGSFRRSCPGFRQDRWGIIRRRTAGLLLDDGWRRDGELRDAGGNRCFFGVVEVWRLELLRRKR